MAGGLPKRSAWLTSLFRRRAADQDLDDEMAAHLQLMIDEKIANGMTHEQARRAAKIELGGMEAVKEAVRDVRVGAWLDTFLQDVRFGLRMLRKNPGFAAVAVLTLALGIGSNTAVFSMVNGILLRQLPYPQAQQLYVVNENVPQLKSDTPWWPWFPVNAGNFLLWQGHCPAVSSMALIGQTTLSLTGEGIPRQVEALRVSSDFFPLMGIRPQIGRAFFAGEDQQGRDHEVILTAPFWRRVFHSDPDMIGKAITLDNAPYTVVGIMPENFRFPELPRLSNDTPDVFKPFGFRRWDFWPGVGGFNYIALARLKPGAHLRAAVAQLNVIEARIASKGDARRQVAPGEFDLRATLRPLKTVIVGPAERALGMLMVAAGLVLLIICVNLASLMLARNLDRTHEVAMRSALGASTLRLTRQFLTEGVVLVVAGVALGLLIAVLGLRFLVASAPVAIPRLREIHLNGHVLLFTAVAAVVCVLLCPLLPALRLSKVQSFEALKSATPAATGAYDTARTRSALVVSQIALCAVLLAGALLLLESLHHVATANQWMDKEHVLSAELVAPPAELRTTQHASQFFSRVLEKVRAVPGVESAGITSKLPLLGPAMSDDIKIREAPHPENRPEVGQFRFVSPGYFQTVGLPLAAGRWLSEADKDKHVAVISESVARILLHGRNPIGMHLLWSQLPPAAPNKIIGVVGDVRTTSDGPAVPTVYLPLWTFYQQPSTLVVRSRIDPAALEKSISGAVWSVDPQVAIPRERTLNTVVSRSEAARRYETSLGAAFAAFALLLAALGLYGVVSYSVRQRTHEIGIRRALGAQPADILRDVLGKGGRMALMGVALGAVAALGLTRLMASMLFGVSATDPLTFAAVVVLLLVVALLACWIPARKAMRVDPMATLRHE